MSNKVATSQKGTTYTQVNDSTYDWRGKVNGYGTIHLDPNSGVPWGTYHVYQGSAGPDKQRKLSQEGLQPHLNNINTLQFEEPEKWWKPIKDAVAPKWNNLLDKLRLANGGLINPVYNQGLLKHITGHDFS